MMKQEIVLQAKQEAMMVKTGKPQSKSQMEITEHYHLNTKSMMMMVI